MHIWKEPEYNLVNTEEKLNLLCAKLQNAIDSKIPIALDIESTGAVEESGLDPYHGWLLGISFAIGVDSGYYIPISHVNNNGLLPDQLPLDLIRDKLNQVISTGGLYLMHNGKFDIKFLWKAGFDLYPAIWDTMIALKLLNGDSRQPAALKKVIGQFVDFPPNKVAKTFEEAANGCAAEQDPIDFCTYAIDDTIFTYYLYMGLKPQIDEKHYKLFYEAEAPLIPILAQMELRGIKIDTSYYARVRGPLEKAKRKIENHFYRVYDVNISSPSQLAVLLPKHAPNFRFPKTPTGGIKTDVEALQKIMLLSDSKSELYKLAKHILTYRGIAKTITTYVDKYPTICHQVPTDNGTEYVLHTEFDQIKNSGRLSSSPNVQNITRDTSLISVRRGFVARPGYVFVEADWSGCELRILTLVSQEPRMLKAYLENPRKADLHQVTADAMEIDRQTAKTINFSIIYGATEYSISKTLNCSKEEALRYLELFFKTYPMIKKWKAAIENSLSAKGYSETYYGRRRYLSFNIYKTMRERWKYEGAVRELINHIIQGTSADLLKFSMVKIAKEFAKRELDAHLLTTTHDSIVVEAKKEIAEEVAKIMNDIMEVKLGEILLPVDISIKDSFAKEH